MIDKLCGYIVEKMKKKMPEIDEEKEEIIKFGLQMIIGELPKMFILIGAGFLFGVGWYMILAFFALLPYRAMSGGFHLKTHIGCLVGTVLFYYGNIIISKLLYLTDFQKIILIILAYIFGILMVSLYAPADTENVPIISKKERKKKKILSFFALSLTLIVAVFIPDRMISNILIIGIILQSLSITRLAYIITKNKYGYEIYAQEMENSNI